MEGIIYLVLLKSANRDQVNEMVAKTNAFLNSIGIEARVKVYNGPEMFNSNNIDKTDSYGIVGSSSEITELFKNHGDNFKEISNLDPSRINDNTTYEEAKGGHSYQGTGFLVKTDLLSSGKDEFKAKSESDFGSFLISHALGHNAGNGHNDSSQAIMSSGGLLKNTVDPNSGARTSDNSGFVTGKVRGVRNFSDVFNCDLNAGMKDSFEQRFGTNSTDNYQRNSERIGPRRADGSF